MRVFALFGYLFTAGTCPLLTIIKDLDTTNRRVPYRIHGEVPIETQVLAIGGFFIGVLRTIIESIFLHCPIYNLIINNSINP